jgi:hypothetical protein
MQIEGPSTDSSQGRPAFAVGIDTSTIIQRVASAKEARALPSGCVIGDLHGGLTFTDAVAAVLESRSHGGWQEMRTPAGEVWTVIVLNR